MGSSKYTDKKRRKELLEQYKQIMGIIQIKNNINGKIFIDTCSNLKNRWFTLKGQLDMGRHPNSRLQKDWNEFGPEAFTYEILEKKEADEVSDVRWELKKMKNKWLEKLQPYEDSGYKPLFGVFCTVMFKSESYFANRFSIKHIAEAGVGLESCISK